MNSMKKNRLAPKNLRARIGVIVLAVLLVGTAGIWLYLRASSEPDAADGSKSSVRVLPQAKDTRTPAPDAQIPNPAPTPNSNVPGGSNNGSTDLAAPSGTFVSNHSPSLSDSSRAQETSVCITTPGASCFIQFTLNGTTKTLDARTADENGAASWDWTPSSLGLTQGSWSIKATATRNSTTKSSQDSLTLNVSP
jgi:hypothetical protein